MSSSTELSKANNRQIANREIVPFSSIYNITKVTINLTTAGAYQLFLTPIYQRAITAETDVDL